MNVILLALLIFGIILAALVMFAYGVSRYREGYDDAKTEYSLQILRMEQSYKADMTHQWDRGYERGLTDQHNDPNSYSLYIDIKDKRSGEY